MYLEPCFEFIDHLTFFFNAYSGRKSESEVIAEGSCNEISGIVSDFKIGLDDAEFDSARELV